MLEGQQEEKQEAVRGGGEHLGHLRRGNGGGCRLAVVEKESGLGKYKLCVFVGQVFGSVSAGFETDASSQNHLPGWSDAARTHQTSQTEPQTGPQRVTGKI